MPLIEGGRIYVNMLYMASFHGKINALNAFNVRYGIVKLYFSLIDIVRAQAWPCSTLNSLDTFAN